MKNTIFLTSDAATVIHDVIRYFDFANKKKTLFIDTSGEDHDGDRPWIDDAYAQMQQCGFDMIRYTITDKTEEEIRKSLKDIHIIYMAGGNTAYLLHRSQQSNFSKIVKDFLMSGGIYIGQSAGSIIAGPDISPLYKPSQDEWFSHLDNSKGYGFVDFIVVPHFGREDKRDAFFQDRIDRIYSDKYKMILLTDRQYIRVQEDGMYKIEEV